MFKVQGKEFILGKECVFNLQAIGIAEGFSLYDKETKQYLCPDHHKNVKVKKGGIYLIRKVFANVKDYKEKFKTSNDHHQHKNENNPFIRFGQDYRNTYPDEKIKVEKISEEWNRLDPKIKEEKYGCKNKKENNNENKKRKREDFNNNNDNQEKEKNEKINTNFNKNELKVNKSQKTITTNKNQKISKKKEDIESSFGSLFGSDNDSE